MVDVRQPGALQLVLLLGQVQAVLSNLVEHQLGKEQVRKQHTEEPVTPLHMEDLATTALQEAGRLHGVQVPRHRMVLITDSVQIPDHPSTPSQQARAHRHMVPRMSLHELQRGVVLLPLHQPQLDHTMRLLQLRVLRLRALVGVTTHILHMVVRQRLGLGIGTMMHLHRRLPREQIRIPSKITDLTRRLLLPVHQPLLREDTMRLLLAREDLGMRRMTTKMRLSRVCQRMDGRRAVYEQT